MNITSVIAGLLIFAIVVMSGSLAFLLARQGIVTKMRVSVKTGHPVKHNPQDEMMDIWVGPVGDGKYKAVKLNSNQDGETMVGEGSTAWSAIGQLVSNIASAQRRDAAQQSFRRMLQEPSVRSRL